MIDVSTAVKSAEALDKSVGLVAKLVGKLKAKPDLAALKLGQALGEVAKTLSVVDTTASEFLSLGIDDGALAKSSKLLLNIDGGSLSTEVQRGRGHCNAIDQIYWKYLDKWFESVFNVDDYELIKTVFQQLGNADGNLFFDLEQVAGTLQQEASIVLDFVMKGDESSARAQVLSALVELRPLRRTISATMKTIYSMQAELVSITGSV